jgi:uncharacterized alkaline shock family protein YloU
MEALERMTGYDVRSLKISVDGLIDRKERDLHTAPEEEPDEADAEQ